MSVHTGCMKDTEEEHLGRGEGQGRVRQVSLCLYKFGRLQVHHGS